jgi:hypothetical protein
MSVIYCLFTYCLAAIVLVLLSPSDLLPGRAQKFSHVNPAALLLAGFFLDANEHEWIQMTRMGADECSAKSYSLGNGNSSWPKRFLKR